MEALHSVWGLEERELRPESGRSGTEETRLQPPCLVEVWPEAPLGWRAATLLCSSVLGNGSQNKLVFLYSHKGILVHAC